jgi:hypothetical protein
MSVYRRLSLFSVAIVLVALSMAHSSQGQVPPAPKKAGPALSLDKVYADQSHCLTDPDMRGDQDMRFSCYCRDALVDLRYVYATYLGNTLNPKYDGNMNGPFIQLELRVNAVCGEGAYKALDIAMDKTWQWPGPEAVRTYPPDEVVARIKPEVRNGQKWRGTPYTIQLVFRDPQGRVSRSETYSRVEWEPCVAGITKPPCAL